MNRARTISEVKCSQVRVAVLGYLQQKFVRFITEISLSKSQSRGLKFVTVY